MLRLLRRQPRPSGLRWLKWTHILALLIGVHAQEVCDGWVPSANAPCTAGHEVIIAFDASMKSADADAALDRLLHSLIGSYNLDGSSNGPRVGLVAFGNEATLLQPLTSNVSELTAAVVARSPSGGNTCTVCGLQLAQQALSDTSRAGKRRVVYLLSDGRAVSACLHAMSAPPPCVTARHASVSCTDSAWRRSSRSCRSIRHAQRWHAHHRCRTLDFSESRNDRVDSQRTSYGLCIHVQQRGGCERHALRLDGFSMR